MVVGKEVPLEYGPPCQDCNLLTLKAQELCYRIMPGCRQFGDAKNTLPIVDH